MKIKQLWTFPDYIRDSAIEILFDTIIIAWQTNALRARESAWRQLKEKVLSKHLSYLFGEPSSKKSRRKIRSNYKINYEN